MRRVLPPAEFRTWFTDFLPQAAKVGAQFGGYVIPRTAGDRPDGLVQKILCVVGS